MFTVDKIANLLSKIICLGILIGSLMFLNFILRLAQENFSPAGYGLLLGFLLCGCLCFLWRRFDNK